MAYTPAQRDEMARIESIVTLSPMYRFNGDDWDSYDLTITRAGRSYPVGQLTIYDDGRGSLILKHHDADRLAVTRKAWRALEDAFNLPASERWQTPRRMICA